MQNTDNSIDVSNLPFTVYCFGSKVYKAVHQTYYLQSHDPMLSMLFKNLPLEWWFYITILFKVLCYYSVQLVNYLDIIHKSSWNIWGYVHTFTTHYIHCLFLYDFNANIYFHFDVCITFIYKGNWENVYVEEKIQLI
jgi:hypothetical protein